MKKFLPLILICTLLLPAQAKQNKIQDPVLNTLEQELKREFKQLKKAKPPVYFLSYQITERDNFYLSATLGAINYEKKLNEWNENYTQFQEEKRDWIMSAYMNASKGKWNELTAGYDIRHGAIGPGVRASHGYERTHIDAIKSTYKLLCQYVSEK